MQAYDKYWPPILWKNDVEGLKMDLELWDLKNCRKTAKMRNYCDNME